MKINLLKSNKQAWIDPTKISSMLIKTYKKPVYVFGEKKKLILNEGETPDSIEEIETKIYSVLVDGCWFTLADKEEFNRIGLLTEQM